MQKRKVIIDADNAMGLKFNEAEDAMPILLLLASPEIEVLGITIVHGTCRPQIGVKNTHKLLSVINREDIPVFPGSNSEKDLGKMNAAVNFMYEMTEKYPGEVSILAVGPLTNLATAMKLDQEFASRLDEIVVMGGAENMRFFRKMGEFNFSKDVKAAITVLKSQTRKTVITLDVCSQAAFTRDHLGELVEQGSPLGKYLGKVMPAGFQFQVFVLWLIGKKDKSWPNGYVLHPWDSATALYLIAPELFDKRSVEFSMKEKGFGAGRIEGIRITDSDHAINLPANFDGEKFIEILMTRLKTL